MSICEEIAYLHLYSLSNVTSDLAEYLEEVLSAKRLNCFFLLLLV